MAVKKNPQDKYVDPLYSRNSGNPPIAPTISGLPTRTRGAGDPNYIKKMIADGKTKPKPTK